MKISLRLGTLLKQSELLVKKSCFLIIDMQNDFISGSLKVRWVGAFTPLPGISLLPHPLYILDLHAHALPRSLPFSSVRRSSSSFPSQLPADARRLLRMVGGRAGSAFVGLEQWSNPYLFPPLFDFFFLFFPR